MDETLVAGSPMKKGESSRPESLGDHRSLRPTAELLRERERHGYQRAALEADRHRRYGQALDRLCAGVFAADGLDNLLQKLVDVFVEVTGAEDGVLRLRDGDRLWSRAAEGLEPKRIRAHHSLNLVDGENLVGVLTLGTLEERELSDEERRLFASLASHAAAAIRRAQEQEALRAAVRARDEVLSVVAHDLKNPLNVISIAANTMLQRTEEPGARRPIERIVRGVQRADRLPRSLLDA